MKQVFIIILLSIRLFTQQGYAANPAVSSAFTETVEYDNPSPLLKDPRDLTIRELQKVAGRKFSLKEKIRLYVLKAQLKKQAKKRHYFEADPDKQARISLIAASLALVVLGLGVLNIITGVFFIALLPAIALVAFWTGLRSRRSGNNFKNSFGFFTGGLILLVTIIGGIVILFSGVI